MPGNLKIDKDFETRKCTTSIGGGGGRGSYSLMWAIQICRPQRSILVILTDFAAIWGSNRVWFLQSFLELGMSASRIKLLFHHIVVSYI